MDDQNLVIAALLSKLGGETIITRNDLLKAEQMEIQRSDTDMWGGGFRLRVRIAPITVEGELAEDLPEIESADGTR